MLAFLMNVSGARLCEVSAQGLDWADPHGASRGQKAGQQGKQKQEPGCKEEPGEIVRADLVEQAAEQAGKGQSQEETGSDAGDREQQSLTQHQPENVGAFGAQREADPISWRRGGAPPMFSQLRAETRQRCGRQVDKRE